MSEKCIECRATPANSAVPLSGLFFFQLEPFPDFFFLNWPESRWKRMQMKWMRSGEILRTFGLCYSSMTGNKRQHVRVVSLTSSLYVFLWLPGYESEELNRGRKEGRRKRMRKQEKKWKEWVWWWRGRGKGKARASGSCPFLLIDPYTSSSCVCFFCVRVSTAGLKVREGAG